MNNNTVSTDSPETVGPELIELQQDIRGLAKAVTSRKISTEARLSAECLQLAHEHYVEISEIYRRVWNKVEESGAFHPTHPAGKTEAYHVLKKRGER